MLNSSADQTMNQTQNDRLSTIQIVLVFFIVVVTVFVGLYGFKIFVTPETVPQENIAKDAVDYIRQRKTLLSGDLKEVLKDPDLYIVKTQEHPLQDGSAPSFTLKNANGKPVSLENSLKDGPVVLIFYYGYYCDHCVAQLFAIHEDIKYFRELGATVFAISSDSCEDSLEKMKRYGFFDFDVLSDPDYQISKQYGVYNDLIDENGKESQELLHGTFILSADGIVSWNNRGHSPFIHNKTLLYHLADLQGIDLPKTVVKPKVNEGEKESSITKEQTGKMN